LKETEKTIILNPARRNKLPEGVINKKIFVFLDGSLQLDRKRAVLGSTEKFSLVPTGAAIE
jgi:hypothetical protein